MTKPLAAPGLQLDRASRAEQFPVGVFRTDATGQCVGVNPRWCELSGLSEEESLGLGWIRAVHPDDRERLAREQARHLALGKNLRIEFRLRRPDGSILWVLSHAVASLDDSGGIDGFVGTLTDITARVAAESALRESEERFRNLVELSPDFVTIHRGGVMQYVNDAGMRMMDATDRSQLVGHHILEFVLPEHQEEAIGRMRELQAGEAIALVEMEIRTVTDGRLWIETIASLTVWNGEPAVQLVARDVTERRKTAESYRIVVENVRDSMWVMDRDGAGEWRFSFVNSSYMKRTGVASPEDILGRSFRDFANDGPMTYDAADEAIARYDEAALAPGPVEFEYHVEIAGRRSFIATTMSPVRDDAGRCNRLICWSRDLTRRREQEHALAESEANYRAVVEGTSDAVWVMDRGDDDVFRVGLANPRTQKLLGLDFQKVVGKALHEFLTPQAAAAATERYRQAEAAGGPIEYENVIERAGTRTEVVTHLAPLFDANGRCYRIIGSARDVSDRRRAETALLQAQKLESLGVLAGGIAHDFNNLLTTILGNLYLLETELPEGSPLAVYANDSRVAADRGADLVRRLLGFSRPGLHARDAFSLEQLFRETRTLVSRTLGPSVDLVFEPGPENDTAFGEFAPLQQVLVNLLLNARDAMPDGGRITVRRRYCDIANEQIWAQRGLTAGPYHEILVTDCGTGMSRDLVQRIFDPFFTTKGVGKGTGLGLSTAFSIVRAHGGWLDVESEENHGSSFRVLLPAR